MLLHLRFMLCLPLLTCSIIAFVCLFVCGGGSRFFSVPNEPPGTTSMSQSVKCSHHLPCSCPLHSYPSINTHPCPKGSLSGLDALPGAAGLWLHVLYADSLPPFPDWAQLWGSQEGAGTGHVRIRGPLSAGTCRVSDPPYCRCRSMRPTILLGSSRSNTTSPPTPSRTRSRTRA